MMADDLAARLAAVLDHEEAEARAGISDILPDFLKRLIARDRALLADYHHAVARTAAPASERPAMFPFLAARLDVLTVEIERAAALWGVPNGS